jgi:hypothetical protein
MSWHKFRRSAVRWLEISAVTWHSSVLGRMDQKCGLIHQRIRQAVVFRSDRRSIHTELINSAEDMGR